MKNIIFLWLNILQCSWVLDKDKRRCLPESGVILCSLWQFTPIIARISHTLHNRHIYLRFTDSRVASEYCPKPITVLVQSASTLYTSCLCGKWKGTAHKHRSPALGLRNIHLAFSCYTGTLLESCGCTAHYRVLRVWYCAVMAVAKVNLKLPFCTVPFCNRAFSTVMRCIV